MLLIKDVLSAIDTMNAKITAVLMVAVMALASLTIITVSEDSDASMTLTDGEGNTIVLDAPAENIITIGVGVTATAIGVNALDKILVCDSYSKTNADPLFGGLKERIAEGKISANGNIYSSGKDQLKIDIIAASEPEKEIHFDREKDVVLAVVSSSYRQNLDFLAEEGYKNVMYWSNVESYNDIVDFVETISKVCNGKVDDNAAAMRTVVNKISTTLEKKKPAPAKAFYVTYSSGTFKVGNTTSLTTVMIEAAGGTVITKDDSKSASTIEVDLTSLIEKNRDAVIFADSQVFNNEGYMKDLRTKVGNDVKIYGLENIWNNFSIESAKGVEYMAGCMYPDIFDSDTPSADGKNDDTMVYIIGGVVAVIIISVVAFFFIRSSGRP